MNTYIKPHYIRFISLILVISSILIFTNGMSASYADASNISFVDFNYTFLCTDFKSAEKNRNESASYNKSAEQLFWIPRIYEDSFNNQFNSLLFTSLKDISIKKLISYSIFKIENEGFSILKTLISWRLLKDGKK